MSEEGWLLHGGHTGGIEDDFCLRLLRQLSSKPLTLINLWAATGVPHMKTVFGTM